MSRIAFRLAAATLLLAYAAPLPAAEIRLPVTRIIPGPNVSAISATCGWSTKIGTNPRGLTVHPARDAHPSFHRTASGSLSRQTGTAMTMYLSCRPPAETRPNG